MYNNSEVNPFREVTLDQEQEKSLIYNNLQQYYAGKQLSQMLVNCVHDKFYLENDFMLRDIIYTKSFQSGN